MLRIVISEACEISWTSNFRVFVKLHKSDSIFKCLKYTTDEEEKTSSYHTTTTDISYSFYYTFPSPWSQIPIFITLPSSEICNHLRIERQDVIRMEVWALNFFWISIITGGQPDAHNLLLNINSLFISLSQNYLHSTQKQEINFSNIKVLNRCFNFSFNYNYWRITRNQSALSNIKYLILYF